LLRSEKIDARHFSSADLDAGLPPGADPDGVAFAILVSAFPSPGRERADSISQQLHELLPQANRIRVFCPGVTALSEPGTGSGNPEPTVRSLGEAIEICLAWHEARNKRISSPEWQIADAARNV
jgi:hypothetical protein